MESGATPPAPPKPQAPVPPPDPSARLGAAIAGAAGVLLFISLFLHWYTVPGSELANGALGDLLDNVGGAVGVDVGGRVRDAVVVSGWEAFEVTDVICCAAAAVAVVRAFVAVLGEDDNPSIPGNLLTAVLGGVALALILYRTVNPPYVGLNREIGLWIGLFAAGGIVYGSYVALRSERAHNSAASGSAPG